MRIGEFARTIPAEAEPLDALLHALEAFPAICGVPAQPACDTQLVCEELASNVIRHGRDPESAEPPEISVQVVIGDGIRIRFEDNGVRFDPTGRPLPPAPSGLEDAPAGGRGILLLRRVTTRFTWRHDAGWNRVEATIQCCAS